MAIWSDIAKWVGPTVNRNAGGTVETRGLVLHIAEGTYEGTISWQKNPSAEVSSHFIVDRNGTIAQMVDTADKAWTQKAGNGHWISVECAGFSTGSQYHTPGSEKLTDAQVAAVARILAKAHQVYGVPLQLATTPSGKGLGHHSMGGTAWGHLDCPGNPIIAQKPAILAAATGGDDMTPDQATTLDNIWALARNTAFGSTDNIPGTTTPNQVPIWVKSIGTRLDSLIASAAADATRDAAMQAALDALAKGGTSIDTAAVVTAVNAAADKTNQTVADLQAQLQDTQARLAAALAGDAPKS